MTPDGPLLKRARDAAFVDIETLSGPGGVVVLAPHPDDESLGCGAAIHRAIETGHVVTIVIVTDGSKSHRASKSWPPQRIAEQRRREAENAIAILTGSSLNMIWLGYADWGVPTTDPELALASDELTDLCDRTGATAIWTAWKGDPHADHQNTAELARTVADKRPGLTLLSYPIWGRFAPLEEASLPRPDAMHLFDSRSHAKVKSEAIEAHQTQMTHLIDDDPEGFTMPGEMQAHFLDFPEIFIEER